MKKLFTLLVLVIASIITNAQNQVLLDESWFVQSLTINGQTTEAPREPEMTIEAFFSNNDMLNEMCCAGEMALQLTYDNIQSTFEIISINTIIENCAEANFNNFRDLYVDFFDYTNDDFDYNISQENNNYFGSYLMLTVTNPAGNIVEFYNTPHNLQLDDYIFDVYNAQGIWYLTGMVVDGTPYPISYQDAYQTTITFSKDGNFYSQICGEIVSKAAFTNGGNGDFYILCENLTFTSGNCQNPDLTVIEQQYYNFLQDLANGNIATFQTYIASFGNSCSEINGIDLYDPATNTWVFLADCVESLSTNSFNQQTITFYPNPVSETLYITIKNHDQAVNTNLYNLNGKLIQTYELNASTQAIDVKNLTNGVYFLVLESENGSVMTKKFVKK